MQHIATIQDIVEDPTWVRVSDTEVIVTIFEGDPDDDDTERAYGVYSIEQARELAAALTIAANKAEEARS